MKIGVVGSGQMGRGIAQVCIQSGYKTFLCDISKESLEIGTAFIKKQLERGVQKGKWAEVDASSALEKLISTQMLSDLSNCDIVIEAATEEIKLKKKIFEELDSVCHKNAILASNTSSISITELAAATNRPSQVVGMHFMNPVPVMKLVEGIRGLETSDEVFKKTSELAQKLGKTFVAVKDYPGFAVNRILMPMINEAIFALYEGVASIEDIDASMKLGTNQPMGPLQLADFIGLDVCLSILNVLYEGFGNSKYAPCPLLVNMVMAGKKGVKSGEGFYSWTHGTKDLIVSSQFK